MKKVAIMVVATLFLLTLFAGTVSAKSDNVQKIDIPKEWQGKSQIVTQKGDLVQVVWIKRVKDDEKNPNSQAARYKPPAPATKAYSLASYRWALSRYPGGVPYTLNPSASGLGEAAVTLAVSESLDAWNDATEAQSRRVTVFAAAPTVDDNAQVESTTARSPDYKNVITWASLSDNNIIAMSTMWYNRWTRELVDADMVFNTYFAWGIDPNGEGTGAILPANTFDIQNIGTHEAGHWASLNDMYASQDSYLTMYGYGSPQETQKISLAAGDIAGVQAAY